MKLPMIDGKAANAICGTKSAQVCNICSASPTEMNRKRKQISVGHNFSILKNFNSCECSRIKKPQQQRALFGKTGF
jgi:hypothetical protein